MQRGPEDSQARLKPAAEGHSPVPSLAHELREQLRLALSRLARLDAVPALIAALDRLEQVARRLFRLLRWLAPRRALGLTGALAWRATAALAGIGGTAALVTSLSAQDEPAPRPPAPLSVAAIGHTPSAVSAGPSSWTTVQRPIAMFDLAAPELGRSPPQRAARTAAGLREDLLSFGGLGQEGPHLVLVLRTGRLDDGDPRPFTVAIAREAAAQALSVSRSSLPLAIETRFGRVETADVVLGDGRETRGCIAFRSVTGEAGFALRGWWCAAGRPSDRRQLTCLIDRIDLVNAADDQALRAAFAASELRRQPACERPHLAATGRKASWLDAQTAAPALRNKTAAPEPQRALPTPRKKPAKLGARGRAAGQGDA